jgi:hypothetical protein
MRKEATMQYFIEVSRFYGTNEETHENLSKQPPPESRIPS